MVRPLEVPPSHNAQPAGIELAAPDHMMMPPRGTVPKPEMVELAVSVLTVTAPRSALSDLTLPDTVNAVPDAGLVLMDMPPPA